MACRRAAGLLALPLAVWLVGPFGHAGSAAAQEAVAADSSSEDARRMFEEGMQAYEEGDFELALERFERSNEIVNSSELLFNIARTAEQIGRHQQALDSYLLYLELEPEAENTRWVERRIAFLETQLAETAPDTPEPEGQTAPLPDPTEDAEPRRELESSDPAPAIALAIAGGALAVTGAVLLSVGLVERAEVEGLEVATPWPEIRDRAERAPVFMGVGGALLGVGAAAVGVAVVLLVADGGSDDVVADARGVGVRF